MDIVQEIREDREKGAKRLEAEYRDRLMAVARRVCGDVEEARSYVNQTFAEAIARIETLSSPDSFFSWMCGILVNMHAKATRRKEHDRVIYTDVLPDQAANGSTEVSEAVDAKLLREAIADLPKELKESLLLHYFMGLPLRQIAKILAVPAGTVMSRLYYARRVLAKRLGADLKKPAVALIAASLLLFAGAAAIVGVAAAIGGYGGAAGGKIAAADSGDGKAAAETAVIAICSAENTKEKTAMSSITVGGFFRKLSSGVATLVTTVLAVNAAKAADPYIESDGTAGLNTGYIMKPTSRLEVDFALTEIGDATKDNRVFGADSVNSGMMYSLYLPNNNSYFAFLIGDGTSTSQYWSSVRASVNGRHTAVFDIYRDKIALLTGSVTNWSRATGLPSFPTPCKRSLTLFGDTDSPSAYAFFRTLPARIYGVKIYEADVLVHDYEPCEKDGMRGYKDRVGGGLATAVNETYYDCLTIGGDYTKYTSPYVATPVNNTDTYINTGYQIVSNTCVALDCALISDWSGTLCYAFGAAGGNDDSAAGNYNIFLAYFRHDHGFAARTLNTSGGWIQGFTPASLLTNGLGGAVMVRRTFAIDTAATPNGTRSAYVKTAGVSNGSKAIHALHLTKPSYHTLCLASAHAGTGTKSSLKIYGCNISELGTPVRTYVPAVVNSVAGLQDSLPGGGFVGAAAGTLTPGGFVPAVTASAAKIAPDETVTFTASAPGAAAYRWYRNGEVIPGETTATLSVAWQKGGKTDFYCAASVSSCAGENLVSEASLALSLENLPKGVVIVIR